MFTACLSMLTAQTSKKLNTTKRHEDKTATIVDSQFSCRLYIQYRLRQRGYNRIPTAGHIGFCNREQPAGVPLNGLRLSRVISPRTQVNLCLYYQDRVGTPAKVAKRTVCNKRPGVMQVVLKLLSVSYGLYNFYSRVCPVVQFRVSCYDLLLLFIYK